MDRFFLDLNDFLQEYDSILIKTRNRLAILRISRHISDTLRAIEYCESGDIDDYDCEEILDDIIFQIKEYP